jgi:hypothetical protein
MNLQNRYWLFSIHQNRQYTSSTQTFLAENHKMDGETNLNLMQG